MTLNKQNIVHFGFCVPQLHFIHRVPSNSTIQTRTHWILKPIVVARVLKRVFIDCSFCVQLFNDLYAHLFSACIITSSPRS